MNDPVRKTLPLPDGDVSCLEWPANGPPLHFAHATGFNAETYRSLLSPLAGQFHIYASDARGHGFSTLPAVPERNASWTTYRDDLVRMLDALGGPPVVLAGHSMGATTSLMAAARRPARVAGLVLIEPVIVPWRAWLLARLPGVLRLRNMPNLADRAALRRDRFPSYEAALAAYRGRGAFKSWSEEMLEDYLKGGLKIDPATGDARLACAPAWEAATFRAAALDAAPFARRISCPLTVIYGTIGSTCRDDGAKELSRGHKDTRVVKVDGASHFLPMEKPELVRTELARFAIADWNQKKSHHGDTESTESTEKKQGTENK
jgi:pimeloyl-ACP methyl ester carboxylesterase